jgi:hypothetical protein
MKARAEEGEMYLLGALLPIQPLQVSGFVKVRSSLGVTTVRNFQVPFYGASLKWMLSLLMTLHHFMPESEVEE